MTNSKKIQFLEINKEELKHAVRTIKTQLLSYEYDRSRMVAGIIS